MKWSSSYLVVSIPLILWDVSVWGGGGGGSLLACNTYGFWCDWVSMVLLADLWSTPEAVLFSRSFHLLLDPVYRVSPVSHTKFSVSASTWCRQLYFSPVLGKHFLVKTGICWLSGGSAFSGTWLLLNMHGMNSFWIPAGCPVLSVWQMANTSPWMSHDTTYMLHDRSRERRNDLTLCVFSTVLWFLTTLQLQQTPLLSHYWH